jgi:hypothetical protein
MALVGRLEAAAAQVRCACPSSRKQMHSRARLSRHETASNSRRARLPFPPTAQRTASCGFSPPKFGTDPISRSCCRRTTQATSLTSFTAQNRIASAIAPQRAPLHHSHGRQWPRLRACETPSRRLRPAVTRQRKNKMNACWLIWPSCFGLSDVCPETVRYARLCVAKWQPGRVPRRFQRR